MAYIKAYDVTIVTAFRATVAKFPNRVMYVNASIGTEWTYSKVMGVKLPLIYHFSLHLRDSGGGGCCCWSKESIRRQGGMIFSLVLSGYKQYLDVPSIIFFLIAKILSIYFLSFKRRLNRQQFWLTCCNPL